MKTSNRYILFALWCLIHAGLMLSTGCANRGIGPQGGPIDSLPPVITKTSVPNGACNVHDKHITMQFDEYIQLNGSSENILISPPQQRPPDIKIYGKKVEINFEEDLQENTTYTIDFGDQIVDNNEKNPYRNLSLSFSTGEQIDSLEVYGQLINAENLNPISGIVIGLHEDTCDTAFSSRPFVRIARTNEEGEFSIKNVKAGTYRLYALQDQSRDYCFQPGEGLAFCDSLITPYIRYASQVDTIYLPDTLDADGRPIADSTITAEYFYYEPSDLLLRFFNEDRQRHYFQRALRKQPHQIQLFFGAPQDSLPILQGLPCVLQANATRDTLTCWLTDSATIRQDTLRFIMTYMQSDSLLNLLPKTDTIQAVYRAPRMTERAKQAQEQKRLKQGLPLSSNAKTGFNYFDTLYIASATPLLGYEADSISLQEKKDSLLIPIPYQLAYRDSTHTTVLVLAQLRPTHEYMLRVDSGAFTDIYGLSSKADQYKITVRSTEEYASITVFTKPYVENAYIQLLNANDRPVRQVAANPDGALFQNIEPGTYYMRLFLDANGDGKWTTGDWARKRQPEQVYYFGKKMNLRANWTFEETWNWQATPLLNQKPTAIRKDENGSKK